MIEGSVEPFEQELVPTQQPETAPAKQEPPPTPQNEGTALEEAEAQSLQTEEETPAPLSQPTDHSPKESRPLWEQFRKGTPTPSTPTARVEEPQPTQSSDSAIPLWMQFQKKPSAPPPTQPPTVRQDNQTAQPVSVQQTPIPQATSVDQATAPAYVTTPNLNTTHAEPTQTQVGDATQAETNQAEPPTEDSTTPPPSSMTLEQLEFSVLGLYGTGNRALFIEHLFSGSPQNYQRLLQQLHNTASWSEASNLIAEEIFKKYNVNIYSPAAIMFTESVEEQYKLD